MFSIFKSEPKQPERGMKTCYANRGYFAYPKPTHANSALAAFVTTRPYVSIIGKIPEIVNDTKRARNALIPMLAMRYH